MKWHICFLINRKWHIHVHSLIKNKMKNMNVYMYQKTVVVYIDFHANKFMTMKNSRFNK